MRQPHAPPQASVPHDRTQDQHQHAAAPAITSGRTPSGSRGCTRTQAITTARDCGCTGTVIVRMDPVCYNAAVIGAVRGQGARFSVTVPVNASIRAAIAAIGEDAWTAIRYPRAIWDDQLDA